MTNWHEDDNFWETTASMMFRTQIWEMAPQQIEDIMARTGLELPFQVLDLPCGVGRHALEFARKGCQVTGVDRTSQYLDEARQHAKGAGLDIEFVQADMRDFSRSESYDLAINLFTSFGYFEDQADDVKVLTNFYNSLRPGGVLVMEMMGKEVLARIFKPSSWDELDDGSLILEERKVTHNWTWVENRWILVKDGQRHDLFLSHRVYSAAELEHLLAVVGFESIEFYGDLAGSLYDQDARRLVAIARR